MHDEIHLSELGSVIETLEYPLSNADAVAMVEGVTIIYPDGEEPLADVVGRSQAESFGSAEDLEIEVRSNVPTEAIGTPGQSEGDG